MSNIMQISLGTVEDVLQSIQQIVGGEIVDDTIWLDKGHNVGICDKIYTTSHELTLVKADGTEKTISTPTLRIGDTVKCIYDKSKNGTAVMFELVSTSTEKYAGDTITIAFEADKVVVFLQTDMHYIYNVAKRAVTIRPVSELAENTVFINAISDDIGAVLSEVYIPYMISSAITVLRSSKWSVGEKTILLGSGIGILID